MGLNTSKIHFILTGGTIDSHWEGSHDTALPNKHSVVPEYIKSLKLYQRFVFTELFMKDSRDLTAKDMKKILETVKKSRSKKIIITHGTYTMTDTAKFLNQRLKRKDQTVILTGSMSPLQSFSISDGPFSLGFALAKVEDLPAGIHICMNGKSFSAEEADKNVKEGRFYSLFQNKQ